MTKDTEKIRGIQTFFWVMMILSQMTVVKCLEVHAETIPDAEVVLYSRIMSCQTDCVQPEKHYEKEGVWYELSDWSVVQATLPSITTKVEQKVIYDRVEDITELPEQISITMQDDERGQTVTTPGQIHEKECLNEGWQEGFSFPVTFHNYHADYYQLIDKLIPHDGEQPGLEGHEREILELAGVSSEAYTITDVQWIGEPYVDGDGIWCRDAEASGKKLVRDYRVIYMGAAVFPEQKGWQTVAVYRQQPEVSEAPTKSHPQPVILPEEIEEPQGETVASLWERITKILWVTVGIGVVLFLGGLLILLWLRVVKKVWSCYNRRQNKTDRGTSYVHRK